jgi:hypothetical protein
MIAMNDELDELAVMNTAHFVKMAYGNVPWLRGLSVDFIKETRGLVPGWRVLLESRNFTQLREELHRCKGGSSIFGFDRLRALLLASESPTTLEARGFDFVVFEQELDAAEKAMAAVVDPGK